MTDIVYILGSGSIWDNNEIKYSLRSVEKHLCGVGNVYSCGAKSSLNIGHIPCEDFPNQNMTKALNIRNKILAACNDERVSENFLVFSDDYFLLESHAAGAYPYFYRGLLEDGMKTPGLSSLYRMVYGNTIKVLKDNKLPTKHFNVHAPILYNKEKAKQALSIADWNTMLGFMSKSLYCNYCNIEGVLQSDCKISQPLATEKIHELIAGRPFFTISDRAIMQGRNPLFSMVTVFNQLYPNKSRWE